jgi:small nuclear ribonucleoprotein (snRNP)-like protein
MKNKQPLKKSPIVQFKDELNKMISKQRKIWLKNSDDYNTGCLHTLDNVLNLTRNTLD